MQAPKMVKEVARAVKADSLTFVVAGFSFASAIAWMDFVRWAVSSLIMINKNSGSAHFLTAVLTTLLSVLIFMVVQRIANGPVEKPKPTFAVTA